MTADEFLMQARTTLTPNPFDRLSPATKLLVEQSNCIFDAHTHIFDRNSVPIPYIALRMLKEKFGYESKESMLADTENFTDPVFNKTEEDWYKYISENRTDNAIDQQRLVDRLNDAFNTKALTSENEDIGGVLSMLNILSKNNMKDVFEHFHNGFSLKALKQYEHHPFVAVVLMMDLETGWNQTLTKPYAFPQ
jgi:hypothetical protein